MKTLKILFVFFQINIAIAQEWDMQSSGKIVSINFVNPNVGWLAIDNLSAFSIYKTADKGLTLVTF